MLEQLPLTSQEEVWGPRGLLTDHPMGVPIVTEKVPGKYNTT